MSPDQINYAPLENMDSAWRVVMRTALGGWAWPLAPVATAISLYLFFRFGTFGIIPSLLFFGYIGKLSNDYENKIWESFARVNGWEIDQGNDGNTLIPPSLNFGDSHHFSPIIKAQLGNTACQMFTYECSTGGGRSRQTHYFTVATTDLAKSVPHILLHTKKGEADVQNDMENAETLKLEGDFNDYFKLQIEKGQEVDALTVITPDVMQTLINYNRGEDVETLNSSLYFITSGDKRDPASVKQLIRSVVELSGQLQENIKLATT